jgi:hypothetical protein
MTRFFFVDEERTSIETAMRTMFYLVSDFETTSLPV